MVWMRRVDYTDPSEAKAKVAIAGFPGIANVGEQVITYLIKELNATLVSKIYSEHLIFPGNMVGISVSSDGSFSIPAVSVFKIPDSELVIVTSDVQPVIWGGMEVAAEVFKVLKQMGVDRVVIITGFVDESLAGQVLVTGEDEDLVKSFLENGAIEKPVIKSIIGLAGVMMTLAKLEGVKVTSLTGVSQDYSPDPRAAREVLKVLDGAFNLKINFEQIDKQIEELEKVRKEILAEIERRLKEQMQAGGPDESSEYVG